MQNEQHIVMSWLFQSEREVKQPAAATFEILPHVER